MINWNRFISYIYRYHNLEKCDNAGFVKVQKKGMKTCIFLGLRDIVDPRERIYSVYLYREIYDKGAKGLDVPIGSHRQLVPRITFVGKMKMQNGRGEMTTTLDTDNAQHTGKPITAFDGVIVGNNVGEDIFCSSWTDNKVDYSKTFLVEEEVDNIFGEEQKILLWDNLGRKNTKTSGSSSVVRLNNADRESVEDAAFTKKEEKIEAALDTEKPNQKLETEQVPQENNQLSGIDKMFITHEKLPAISGKGSAEDQEILWECVKITPNDIGLMDMSNWKLGVNSFLTHGFYSYKYLMLGRVDFGDRKQEKAYILGVPGIYTSKENYLAGIFGFDRFVCQDNGEGTETGAFKTGKFGYYITPLSK